MHKMEINKNNEYFSIENRRYLGSKVKLIGFIHEVIKTKGLNFDSVLDIFGGTGNVAYSFNDDKTQVIVNDLLYSNYICYMAWFGSQPFNRTKLTHFIDTYNKLDVNELDDNYFSKNFSNTYFSMTNCKKIGFIREDIENNYKCKKINERERAILITSLIYAMDHIANTVGHYDAYRLNGDLDKKLIMRPLNIPSNENNKNNLIFREDANVLAGNIYSDLVYIDPPYNSRQYCDAYHLLENVAEWKKPPVFGVARKMERSSSLKSKYCTQKATLAFEDLINKLNCKYILVSYNNTGTKGAGRSQAKLSDNDIVSILSKKGKVEIFSREYRQFTTGKTEIDNHEERLFLCRVGDSEKKNAGPIYEGYAKSPLNYTGGKYKLLSQFKEKFPQKYNVFVDLFGGGFNVGANLGGKVCIYNDSQKEVTELVKLLYKNDPETVAIEINKIIDEYNLSKSSLNGYSFYKCKSDTGLGSYNKKNYEKLRTAYNNLNEDSATKYFMLLTLIIFSFNNQIRFNSKGEFNMPVGKRDFNSNIQKNIIRFCGKLHEQKIKFYSKDFRKMKAKIQSDYFVYCDPPYLLGDAAYNENNCWSDKDDADLLTFLSELNSKGILFALSNVLEHKGIKNQRLLDWALNNHFNINYITASYNNSNYHLKSKNGNSIEVLITNY